MACLCSERLKGGLYFGRFVRWEIFVAHYRANYLRSALGDKFLHQPLTCKLYPALLQLPSTLYPDPKIPISTYGQSQVYYLYLLQTVFSRFEPSPTTELLSRLLQLATALVP